MRKICLPAVTSCLAIAVLSGATWHAPPAAPTGTVFVEVEGELPGMETRRELQQYLADTLGRAFSAVTFRSKPAKPRCERGDPCDLLVIRLQNKDGALGLRYTIRSIRTEHDDVYIPPPLDEPRSCGSDPSVDGVWHICGGKFARFVAKRVERHMNDHHAGN